MNETAAQLLESLQWHWDETRQGRTACMPDASGQPVVLSLGADGDACMLLHGGQLARFHGPEQALRVALLLADMPLAQHFRTPDGGWSWDDPAMLVGVRWYMEDGVRRPSLALPESMSCASRERWTAQLREWRDLRMATHWHRWFRPQRMVSDRLRMAVGLRDLRAHELADSLDGLRDEVRAMWQRLRLSAFPPRRWADGSLMEMPVGTAHVTCWADLLDLLACLGLAPAGWDAQPTRLRGTFNGSDSVRFTAVSCGRVMVWRLRDMPADSWTADDMCHQMLVRVRQATLLRQRASRGRPERHSLVRGLSLRGLEQ